MTSTDKLCSLEELIAKYFNIMIRNHFISSLGEIQSLTVEKYISDLIKKNIDNQESPLMLDKSELEYILRNDDWKYLLGKIDVFNGKKISYSIKGDFDTIFMRRGFYEVSVSSQEYHLFAHIKNNIAYIRGTVYGEGEYPVIFFIYSLKGSEDIKIYIPKTNLNYNIEESRAYHLQNDDVSVDLNIEQNIKTFENMFLFYLSKPEAYR